MSATIKLAGIKAVPLMDREANMINSELHTCIAILLDGVPNEGGIVSREILVALIEQAFEGGHIITLAAVQNRIIKVEDGGAQ